MLGVAFLLLVLLYLPLALEKTDYLLVTFILGFCLVLSHQLATFLAAFMLLPIILFMLVKSRGKDRKNLVVLIALLLGGGVAFGIYYLPAMLPYLGTLIYILFYFQTSYAYQIPSTSFNAFLNNFSFLFILAIAGVALSYYLLMRVNRKPFVFLTLMLSFFVPLFFAESWLLGFYLPFQWFNYYLSPPMAILAAVSVVFAAEKFSAYYSKYNSVSSSAPIYKFGRSLRKNWLKITDHLTNRFNGFCVGCAVRPALRKNLGGKRLLLDHRHKSL